MKITKEKVFDIMGKYYGNAYWREAIKYDYSEEQLLFVKEILDEINNLGYNFSNLQRLADHKDERFIPIVLKYIHQKKWWISSLLDSFNDRSYYEYTPELISLYNNPEYSEYKWSISNAILQIRHKKYISWYLEIVNNPMYGKESDLIMEILCIFKVKQTLRRLLELYELYPQEWCWVLLKYGWYFKNKDIISYIEPYTISNNDEYRRMAIYAIKKLCVIN